MPRILYKDKAGKRIPSVTTILSGFKDPGGLMHWAWSQGMDGIDYKDAQKNAAAAGTIAHALIESELLGTDPGMATPSPSDLGLDDERYQEALEKAGQSLSGFRAWRATTLVELVGSEVSLVDDELRFGGTLDAIGRLPNGDLCLLDWKTSNRIYADYLIQVAAYIRLWENGRPLHDGTVVPFLGQRVGQMHLLRVGKDYGDFHHHSWPIEVLDVALQVFLRYRECYDLMSRLDKAVG